MSALMVSVIIPCRNEIRSIGGLLDDLAAQGGEGLTVIVADGCSEDGTWELLQARAQAKCDPFILVPVCNLDRTIPHGLNRAVEVAADGIIIRLDAHGHIEPGHLQAIVEAIGGRSDLLVGPRIVMVPSDNTTLALIIAAVLNSPIGSGGTPSRGTLAASRVVRHTVMSCWHRAVWVGNGGFDESLLSNEDFAFDWAAGERGCAVHSLPAPTYLLKSRGTLSALARQRWRYGWWKAVVLRRHPSSVHLRQILPVLVLVMAVLLAFIAPLWLMIFTGVWILLVFWLVLPSIFRERPSALMLGIILAPITAGIVQFVWAIGLILGMIANHPAVVRQGNRA